MKKLITISIFYLFSVWFTATAQVSINSDGSPPDSSAMFQVESSGKGFLLPRLTLPQVEAIVNPAEGLLVYCIDLHSPALWNGSMWVRTSGKPFYKIGEKKEGGMVFYVYPSGLRALIIQDNILLIIEMDQIFYWGYNGYTGAIGTAIGTGPINTTLAGLHQSSYTAINYCRSIQFNSYNPNIAYVDWFLPSLDELTIAWTNCPQVFPPGWGECWSSTESGSNSAWIAKRDGTILPKLKDSFDPFVLIRETYFDGCSISTLADAGPDQINVPSISTLLQGNVPLNVDTGQWNVLTGWGIGGNFLDPSNPSTEFSGIEGRLYMLRWTVSSDCASTRDDVIILFDCPTANAGPDQYNLADTVTTLQGNAPFAGNGLWTIIQGTGGTVTSPSDPESTFSGISGETYILRWTITSNCQPSEDDVVIGFQ